MLLGMIRCLEAVGDILEYGPVEAVRINTALVPEAERSYREIMKNIDKPILESGYGPTVSAQGKSIRDIGRASASRKRTDAFREAVEKAVRDRMSDNCYSEEHHLQIKDLAYDMHDCLSDFLEKASEKYEEEETFAECEELPELDASDYGSGDYDYGRLSQAKVSCRDALMHAVTDMRDYYEEDDESYCYKIEDVVCSLNDMIRECYVSACGQMDEQVRKLYQSALDEVADVLSAGLVGLI